MSQGPWLNISLFGLVVFFFSVSTRKEIRMVAIFFELHIASVRNRSIDLFIL